MDLGWVSLAAGDAYIHVPTCIRSKSFGRVEYKLDRVQRYLVIKLLIVVVFVYESTRARHSVHVIYPSPCRQKVTRLLNPFTFYQFFIQEIAIRNLVSINSVVSI